MPDGNESKGVNEVGHPCPFCGGTGVVSGMVDDVEFVFKCVCSGGSEEAVRWLLGSTGQLASGDDWII